METVADQARVGPISRLEMEIPTESAPPSRATHQASPEARNCPTVGAARQDGGMHRRFTGWPTSAYDVLLELDGDPPLAVRERCRSDREQLVRAPMIALLQDLADADLSYDDFTVEGFVSPYYGRWQHQLARIRIARNVTIDLAFDLDGLHLSGLWWPAAPEVLQRYRTAVAGESSGADLSEILRRLEADGRRITGDVMKRMPRGHAADHPRADLLGHRSLTVELPLGCEDWLHTPDVVDHVLAASAELRPFTSWFTTHVVVTPG